MKHILFAAIFCLMSGCAVITDSAPDPDDSVRLITPATAIPCKYLGSVSAKGSGGAVGGVASSAGAMAAIESVKSQVWDKKGNAAVVVGPFVDKNGYVSVLGDAYTCPF